MTATTAEESDLHPVAEFVKTKRVVPNETAVTNPVLEMVATPGLEDVQVPPLDGLIWVELPIHKEEGPEMLMTGLPFTVICAVGSEIQP